MIIATGVGNPYSFVASSYGPAERKRSGRGRLGRRFGATVVLPAAYVPEQVDLGYAVNAHCAQGMTVDTAHVVVSGSTTRENLFVSMTRGRESNSPGSEPASLASQPGTT